MKNKDKTGGMACRGLHSNCLCLMQATAGSIHVARYWEKQPKVMNTHRTKVAAELWFAQQFSYIGM